MNPWLAAAATAVVVSERGRKVLRVAVRAGIAGATSAAGTIGSAATGAAHVAGRAASSAAGVAGGLVSDANEARESADTEAASVVAVPPTAAAPTTGATGTARAPRRAPRPKKSAAGDASAAADAKPRRRPRGTTRKASDD